MNIIVQLRKDRSDSEKESYETLETLETLTYQEADIYLDLIKFYSYVREETFETYVFDVAFVTSPNTLYIIVTQEP